ncbi:hypothetical protein KCP78_10170 [Salmonella enterica subsp. enterica]|nr:hypothetical protein KCP78_10170 [Salmonella enterica subsp. enterica]
MRYDARGIVEEISSCYRNSRKAPFLSCSDVGPFLLPRRLAKQRRQPASQPGLPPVAQ